MANFEEGNLPHYESFAVHMGDGWCTFNDLDNFDCDRLLNALTLKEKNSNGSIWDPSLSYTESCQRKGLSISALRQLEALFNLSQLLFGLSRAETVNYTFRDLQLRKCPRSFKKSGFKMLKSEGRLDFYGIFEKLVNQIIQEGGLEVTLLIYKNPMLPMVRQKCLDLISNLTTVPDVATKIIKQQCWFLDHLLIMVRDGDLVSDKIPALSVLIRLLKVMLVDRMISSYMKLVDLQYVDCIVDILEDQKYTNQNFVPFFVKFEFISMQSLTVILGDDEYSQFWSDKAKARLLKYCMLVLLKSVGASANANEINHIYYAEKHTNKHSLAHTIMTITELLRYNENMKLFYRYHKPFKQLIVQLIEKYGAKSKYIRTDPGISYALNHLMRVLYIKSLTDYDTCKRIEVSNQPRICSNPNCNNEETKYKVFNECSKCYKVSYCSRKCKKLDNNNHQRKCKQINNIHEPEQELFDNLITYDMHNRNMSKGKIINGTLSYSKTKRIAKYSSMKDNHQLSKNRYTKYMANSFKENLINNRRHSTELYKNNVNEENSVKFIRPLKTSTVVCLNEKTKIISNENQTKDSKLSFSSPDDDVKSYDKNKSFDNNNLFKKSENNKLLKKTSKRRHSCIVNNHFQNEILILDFPNFNLNVESKTNNQQTIDNNSKTDDSSSSSSFMSSSTSFNISSSTDNSNTENDDIEDIRVTRHTRELKNCQMSVTFSSNQLISDDENERISQLKVMKEFERTLHFANDFSKIIFTQGSNSMNTLKHSIDKVSYPFSSKTTLKPQISLETLYYDRVNSEMNPILIEKEKITETMISNKNDIKYTIKDMLPNTKDIISINSFEQSDLKNESRKSKFNIEYKNLIAFTHKEKHDEKQIINMIPENHEYKADSSNIFKKPLQKINYMKNEYEIETNDSRFKLTSNRTMKDTSIFSNASTFLNGPQESTPIYNCEITTNARRKYLISQLDLNSTFGRVKDTKHNNIKKEICENINSINCNEITKYDITKENTNKLENVTNKNLIPNLEILTSINNSCKDNNIKQSTVQKTPLNISQYAALTNASATGSFVVITKAEIPKDLKKSLKDEFKRDKKNCILQ